MTLGHRMAVAEVAEVKEELEAIVDRIEAALAGLRGDVIDLTTDHRKQEPVRRG